ncbi:anaphase-promoting complex subunit 4 [Austrofundulus limnaeus]|nr:PREDICTED: anaphase-promoting complex subunit 4-like [Austrofundulus limnaeus]
MKAQFVAVNGIRKVACVLSANLRHIRVFEMDVEDEDDEGIDSHNVSADQDGLETTVISQGPAEESVESEEEATEQERDVFQKTVEHLKSEEAL